MDLVLSLEKTNPFRACLHEGGGPQIGEVICGGSPQLSCERDQIKMRDNMPSVFFFGVTLVHVNLCMHTFTHMTVTLRGQIYIY